LSAARITSATETQSRRTGFAESSLSTGIGDRGWQSFTTCRLAPIIRIIQAVMTSLSSHLDRLLRQLESFGLQSASTDVRIVEVSQISPDGTYHVRRDQLRKPMDYESRFDELLATGYSWLNISCYGVQNGSLIVGIEVPDPGNPRTLYPGCATSVNLSWRISPDGTGSEYEWNVATVLTIE
jgi:hypothetical protein